ncbi:putative monooxygenase [Xylariales sp. PMI_506]|nr:putative monooxygenase [Xylariales sp. PMI_506]
MSSHSQTDQSQSGLLSSEKVKFHPSTGISILIVGAGVGGLMSALECRRKGHDVRVVERTQVPSTAGDFFSIGSPAIRQFHMYWPELANELERVNYGGWELAYHTITGERISGPEPVTLAQFQYQNSDGQQKIAKFHRQSRPKFAAALLDQVRSVGVNIDFGKRVVDYFESEREKKAGVVLEDGNRMEADVVIAADGIGTKSHKLINGHDIRAYPSGFSIFRTAFPVELVVDDSEIKNRWPLIDGSRPIIEMWQGDNVSFGVGRYHDVMNWHLMYKDTASGKESWSDHVDISKVLDIISKIPGFPDAAIKLIKKTPKDSIIDWALMWRDPQERWVSPLGHVVQVGDSAHTFLPSSGNGATQAIEDAISLATCLQIGGSSNISWATKIHNKLRFERVSCFQLNGFINHQRQNNSNLKAVVADVQPFMSNIGKWAIHDPESYAYNNYGMVLFHLLTGAPFRNTNIPPGYTPKAWGIEEMFDVIESGRELQFEGDWS